MNKITLHSLLQKYSNKDIIDIYMHVFNPDEISLASKEQFEEYRTAYLETLDELRSFKYENTDHINNIIRIDFITDDGEPYYSVSGQNTITNIKYALSLDSWGLICNLPIDKSDIEKYGELICICAIFWEITFYGSTDEDVQDFHR